MEAKVVFDEGRDEEVAVVVAVAQAQRRARTPARRQASSSSCGLSCSPGTCRSCPGRPGSAAAPPAARLDQRAGVVFAPRGAVGAEVAGERLLAPRAAHRRGRSARTPTRLGSGPGCCSATRRARRGRPSSGRRCRRAPDRREVSARPAPAARWRRSCTSGSRATTAPASRRRRSPRRGRSPSSRRSPGTSAPRGLVSGTTRTRPSSAATRCAPALTMKVSSVQVRPAS